MNSVFKGLSYIWSNEQWRFSHPSYVTLLYALVLTFVLRPLCWTNWTQTQTNKEPLKLHAGQLWVWIGCQTLLQKYFHSCKFEKIPLAYYPGPETWFLYFHVGRSNWRTQPSCTDFNKKHIWLIIDLWQTVSSIPFSGDHGWFYVPGKNPSTWFIYLPGER